MLADKSEYQRRVKVLISAVGSLSTPKKCEIPGADTFEGRLFHSARWDHSFDYTDKQVVVLGKWKKDGEAERRRQAEAHSLARLC